MKRKEIDKLLTRRGLNTIGYVFFIFYCGFLLAGLHYFFSILSLVLASLFGHEIDKINNKLINRK